MGSSRVRLYLLALLAIHASADKCIPSTCFSSNKSPLSAPTKGQQFTYDFESTATAQLVNKDTVETSVSIKGQAVIVAGDNCGYTLTLKGINSFGSDNSKLAINQKEFQLPVQFTLSGDELAPELCADSSDKTFSLNVKRGVISALQNGLGKSAELDIFGKCPVSSSSSTSGGVTTVSSSRDLDQCAYREKLSNGLIQGVVTDSSEIKSSPILSGKVDSDAKFQNGALQSIELREVYNFLPFSTQNHGAKAKVLTKMNLKKTDAGQSGAEVKNPILRTLLFENTHTNLANPKVSIKDSIKTAFGKVLKEFTGQEGVITSHSAATFAEIIRLMRLAKKNDLLTSYQEVKKGTLSDLQKQPNLKIVSRSIFLDALFRTGTGESVATLADIAKKELNEKEQKLMFLSFNLVQSVTKEAITGLAKLFSENLPKEAYLSIGSVVNKYCRDRGCDAGDVKIIADKFIAKIPKDCETANKKDEEQLVAVLKGIRNSQTILNSALDKIIQCASNKNPSRVRVAALQAFTANPCNKRLQQAATTVLKNRDEDSEVRIEAYLAAIECPSGNLANDVQSLLDSEPINQVGSFINTHLDSIQASTDTKREDTRAHFKNLRTSRKFPFDPRRYSFNREISYAVDSLGLGSAFDASVIYSQQSFLPRSVRFNMTGNLFGSAFNMLEISARQENLESLLEHYLGPRGIVTKMSRQELYDTLKKEMSAINRQKRDLPADLNAFDKNVKLSNEHDREPDLDLSVKVFGSELYFLSMSQNIPATPGDLIKLFAQEFSKGVDSLKNFQYNFENHALWMDGEIVYPTALGLPFKLTSTGASAVKVDLSGAIDVKKLMEDPLNSKVQLKFSPAVNIFVAGQLGFSSFAYETALEVSGTIYTNTGFDTNVEIQGGRNVIVTKTPTIKDQYVIDLNHQISTVSQESGREAVKIPVKFKGANDRETELCFDQVEFLTGFTFCTHIMTTPLNITENAHWPLYGNNQFNIKLEMVDEITFRGEFDDKDPAKPAINLYYRTPKDGKERQTSLKFLSSFNPEHLMGGFDLSVPVQVESPFKIDAAAGLVNQENEKKIYLSGNYLGGDFKYELGFKRKGKEIIPILKFNTEMTYLDGKIIEEKTANGVKYNLKQVKFGRDAYVTVVDGSIEINGPKIIANLKFQQGQNNVNLVGSVGYQQGQLESDVQLTSPQVDMANGKLKYALKFTDKSFSNDLNVIWDKDLNTKTNKLDWNQLADWSDKDLFKTKNALTIGKFNTAGRFNGEFGQKIIGVDTGIEYSNQKAELKLDNKYSQKAPHDFDTSIYAAANQKSIRLEMKRDIEGESSKVTNKLELSTGLKLELNGKIGHKFECTNADISLQAVFVPAPKKDHTKATFVLKNTEKEHSATSKVQVGKSDFANWESKLTYGNQMVGSLKASVGNDIKADGTFQSTNGKGSATISGSLKDRKVKAETQFTIQKPTYDFSSDIFYDFEKDNTKKVHFSTKNNVGDSNFNSKNEVELFSERYGFNVDASKEGTFIDGKQKASAEIQLPTGRKLSTTVEREAKMANKQGNGKFHLTATDELPNKQQRQAILDLKITDFNPKAGFFDFIGSYKYRTHDNKDLKVQLALKNLQKGHFSAANGMLQVDGTLVPEVTTLNLKLDEYCENHAIYGFSGKYGATGDINVNGKFYVATKDRPHSHEFTGVLNLPDTKLQKLTVTSNGQLTEPADPSGSYIVKYSGAVDLAGKKAQVETDLKVSSSKGSGSAKLQLPDTQPIGGEISFSCNHKDKADGSFTVTYGKNNKFSTSFNAQREGEDNVNIDVTIRGDLETFKEIVFHLNAKKPSENEITAKATLKADSQQYSLDYEHRLNPKEPRFSVVLTRPQGTSKILAEAQIESQLKGKGSLAVENVESFNLHANVDGDLSSIDNFYVKGEIDSAQIGLSKLAFDVKSKNGAAGSTGFDFKLTKDGNHLVSGTTDFTTKNDKGRTIVEGKSTIKLTDGKADEVSFKLIRNIFEKSRDGETGFGGILTVIVGPRNFAGELKLTDKEFHSKYTGCETSNRCTNLETRSKLEKSSLESFKHNLVITIDLRQVGFSHEFGLKADTSRDGWKFSHSVDAYLQSQDKPEYQYSLSINPSTAGALLSLPNRQVALDATYKYPQATAFGVYDATMTFYMDKKNKPRQKSEIGFRGELKQDGKNLITGKGDINFQHPRVKKLRVGGEFGANADAMDVNSKLEFDVFTNPMDKIVVTVNFGNTDNTGRGFNIKNGVEIDSKGLGFNLKYNEHASLSFDQRAISIGSELTLPVSDFRFGVNANVNDKSFDVNVIGFGQQVLKSNANYDLGKQDFSIETTIQYFGSEPVLQKSSINGLTEGVFTMTKGNLIDIDSGYSIGKDVHLVVKGSGKEIFNGKIALDQSHFLTSNYHVDEAQLKAFAGQLQDQIKKDYQRAEEEVKGKFNKLSEFWNQKYEKIVKATPDFSQFKDEYRQELNKLVEELKSDPAIKKLIDQSSAIVGELAKTFNTIFEAMNEQLNTIENALRQHYEQALNAFNEKLLPQLKKLYESLQALVSELYEQAVKILSAAFERIAKALKTFEEDFNAISKTIRDATGNVYESVGQYIKEIIQEVKDLIELFKQQLQTLPGVEFVKEKYSQLMGEFSPIETLKVVLSELINSLGHVVPEQAKPLFVKFADYVQKKLDGEQVDDLALLKELYKALMEALSGFKKEYIDGFSANSLTAPINLNIFKRLPPFITNVRFSGFNQLRSQPIINLRDLIYLYRPYAFNPAELIPPFTLHGEVSDGSHFFTFDGRHLTFPGQCGYILARDFVEGNFSIVANLVDGKLKSITLTDKSGYAEISSGGALKVDGKAAEYPHHQTTLHAWRSYHTVSLLTQYGAGVECSSDLMTCHIRVSGFYSGKTRGLLGNGNAEPYDDYLLPTGKITESTSELGNAYRTRQDCAAVTKSGDDYKKAVSNEFCSQYFGRDSSLRMCLLFVNPSNYREACEHAVQGAPDAQKAACAIATTYASRCRQEFIPVSIPKACSSCSVANKPLDVGDEISVKVPQKSADVVVVFDTKLAGQLSVVQEVVNELKSELKKAGVSDIHIGAIGYNTDDKYLYQYTSKGELNFNGNFATVKSNGPKRDFSLHTGQNEVDAVLDILEKGSKIAHEDLGLTADARAFQRAMKYPFRATASKAILAFRSDGIPYSANPGKLLAGEISGKIAFERGIGIYAVMPVAITEPADRAKNIVGFNSNVALLVNEKKRPNMGSVDIANKLKYESDMGVDLTRKNGYVFNLNAYQTDSKKFVGVVGYVLADVISRTEVQSDCKCVLASGLYAETRCKATEQKLLAPSTKKTQRGR